MLSGYEVLPVRSGNVNSGSLRNAGNNGNYWSSTAYSSTSNAYNLNFNSGNVNPSNNNNRYNGQSVRCLARGLGAWAVRCDLVASLSGALFCATLLNPLSQNVKSDLTFFQILYLLFY